MHTKFGRILPLCAAAALLLATFAGCGFGSVAKLYTSSSPTPGTAAEATAPPSPETTVMTQSDIQSALKAAGDKVIAPTWAPDSSAVAFVRANDSDTGYVCLWPTTAPKETQLYKATGTEDGFLWSPDSQYVLVLVGHMGPGTVTSTIVDAKSLSTVGSVLTSVNLSPPVWSPDGRFIALSTYDESTGAAAIVVYTVGSGTTITPVKGTNSYGPYVVASWDATNTITYTEPQKSGERTKKTIGFGE